MSFDMMTIRLAHALLAAPLLLAALACSQESSTENPGFHKDSSASYTCDGGTEPRFLYQYGAGSGMVSPGASLLDENGYALLVLDGQCRYFAKAKSWDAVRTGSIDAAAFADIAARLRFESWDEADHAACESIDDGPWMEARFDEHLLATSALGCPNGSFGDLFQREARSLVAELHDSGTALEGPVRYLLLRGDHVPARVFDDAALWPLSMPASELAVNEEDATALREKEGSHVAQGEAAVALRDIANRYRQGELGPQDHGFIPIQDGEGGVYQLYVRDTIAIEDGRGVWRVTR